MWPWVLGSAALGGLQAYQQSGGDVGKTLAGAALGGGLGAMVPGVGRFAGTALEGTGALAPLASGLTKAATKGRQLAGLAGPVQAIQPAQIAKLAGTGAMFAAGSAVPSLAAGLAGAGRPAGAAPSKGTGPVEAAGGAAGLYRAATFQPSELVQPQYSSTAVPGGMAQPAGLIEQQNPLGAWQANLQYQRQVQDLTNQNTMRLANYQVKLDDEVKRRDLLRNAAAAKLKTDLATTSALTLGGQQIAGAQATQALADIGAAARTQYQYL